MDVKDVIREREARHGSLAAAARELGVKRQYLWGILNDKWGASDNLLNKLGLERKLVRVKQ